MKIQQKITKILSTMVAAALCLAPEFMGAQQNSPSTAPAATSNSQDKGQTGATIDPSKAPLQPVTTYPEAPTPKQQDQPRNDSQSTQLPATTSTEPPAQTQKPATEPVGAAAAESVPTAGGAASKPAGAAIAPAKQHQTRSLFIKIGAIAAGGVAAGTVYALSHSTPSKPPGTGTPGATQK